jgi:hypothetical protein
MDTFVDLVDLVSVMCDDILGCCPAKLGSTRPGAFHEPTVKDSPQPQASLMFGFLNANFALGKRVG